MSQDVFVVGLSVCDVTDRYPAKTAGPIVVSFGMWDGVRHSHHVLDGGNDLPTGRDSFGVGKGPSHSEV